MKSLTVASLYFSCFLVFLLLIQFRGSHIELFHVLFKCITGGLVVRECLQDIPANLGLTSLIFLREILCVLILKMEQSVFWVVGQVIHLLAVFREGLRHVGHHGIFLHLEGNPHGALEGLEPPVSAP